MMAQADLLLSTTPDEEVDRLLRDAGGDPDEIGERGAKQIEEYLALKRRLAAIRAM